MEPVNTYLALELKAAYDRIEQLEKHNEKLRVLWLAECADRNDLIDVVGSLRRRVGIQDRTIRRLSRTSRTIPERVQRTLYFDDETDVDYVDLTSD